MQKADGTRFIFIDDEIAPQLKREAEIVLPNMRGACVTVGNVVHTLFRLPPRTRSPE